MDLNAWSARRRKEAEESPRVSDSLFVCSLVRLFVCPRLSGGDGGGGSGGGGGGADERANDLHANQVSWEALSLKPAASWTIIATYEIRGVSPCPLWVLAGQ